MKRSIVGLCYVLLLVIVVPALLNAQATGSRGNPGVVPPGSKTLGLTYGEWSARWWEWAFSIPKSVHPLAAANASCSEMQTGGVWFLGGKFTGSSGYAIRNCMVPGGTYLFFPIANWVADDTEVDANGALTWDSFTTDYLRSAIKSVLETSVISVSCTVDGNKIEGLDSIKTTPYRVQSPVFSYSLPATTTSRDNLLGLDLTRWTPTPPSLPSTYTGTVPWVVADGAFLMLSPLSSGFHTIHFAASFTTGFWFDITYFVEMLPVSHW